MKTNKRESKKISAALALLILCILSLLIHLLFFGTFFKYGFISHAKKLIFPISLQKKSQTKNNLPAKLVAPKSNFGWVIFDEQQSDNSKIPHHPPKIVSKQNIPTSNSQTTVSKKIVMKSAVKTVKHEKQIATCVKTNEALQNYTRHDKAKVLVHNTYQPIDDVVKQDKNNIDNNKSPKDDMPENQQPEMSKDEERDMILSSILCKNENTNENKNEQVTDVVCSDGNKKSFGKNIIKMTKGFIEKIEDERGTDLIDRDGDPNKKPNFEELKYISYLSKITWTLQASWKNNFKHNSTFQATNAKTIIEFTINESGDVISSTLVQSSGHSDIDKAVMKNTELASPFPPIPKHFKLKTFTIRMPITVYINSHNFTLAHKNM